MLMGQFGAKPLKFANAVTSFGLLCPQRMARGPVARSPTRLSLTQRYHPRCRDASYMSKSSLLVAPSFATYLFSVVPR
jgi:hypothetical protein